MTTVIYEFSVEGVTYDKAERYLIELRDALLDASKDVSVRRVKRDPSTMELGSVLVVIVTSATATAIARGVADWLRKRNDAHIKIRDETRNIEVGGLTAKDAMRVLEIIAHK
jgi:hypothetical protein